MTADLRRDSEQKEDLRKPRIRINLDAIPQGMQEDVQASATKPLGKQADQKMSKKGSKVSSAKVSHRDIQGKQLAQQSKVVDVVSLDRQKLRASERHQMRLQIRHQLSKEIEAQMTSKRIGANPKNAAFQETPAKDGGNIEETNSPGVVNDNMAESQHSRGTIGSLQEKHDQKLQGQKKERLQARQKLKQKYSHMLTIKDMEGT